MAITMMHFSLAMLMMLVTCGRAAEDQIETGMI